MAGWILVPCLVTLRAEFDAVTPKRDRGADGSIRDQAHTSSSDHTPDEDSAILRDHDADSKNEVHALDIDCTGPWPDGRGGEAGAWFDRTVRAIVDREREELHSPDVYGRLQYVIWRGRITSRSWGWSEWRDYTGPSAHFDHAHFSARYLTRTETDTRPWGVADEGDGMADITQAKFNELYLGALNDPKIAAKHKVLPMQFAGAPLPAGLSLGSMLAATYAAAMQAAGQDVDEQQIIAGILAGLPAEQIAAAIPQDIAAQVVDELSARTSRHAS